MPRLSLMVVLLVIAAPAVAAEPKLPYPRATIEAWIKAGAEPAVMVIDGEFGVFSTTNLADRRAKGFGFEVRRWTPGQLKNLPDPGEPFGLGLGESGATDAALAELAPQKNLRVLILYGLNINITDAGLKHVANLPGLQELYLDSTTLTDDGLKALAQSPSLQRFNLRRGAEKLTAAGMAHLQALKTLRRLDLDGTELDLAAVTALSRHEKLRALSLSKSALRKNDFKIYQSFPALETLCVTGAGVDDDAIRHIAKIERLKELNCRGADVHDDTLKALAAMPNLERLNVHGCPVTDAGMAHLKDFPKLAHLVIGDRPLTDATLRELAKVKTLKSVLIYRPAMTKNGLREFWKTRKDLEGWVEN